MTITHIPKNFAKLNKFNKSRKKYIRRNFPQYTSVIEDTLVYLIQMHNHIFLKGTKMNLKMNQVQTIKEFLLMRNAHYLLGSYQLISCGLNSPCRALHRVVLESIIHIYFYHLFPTDSRTKLSMKSFLNKLSKEDTKNKKKFRNLNINEFIDILYKDKTKIFIKNLYHSFCLSSHPDIKGFFISNIEFNQEMIRDNMELTLCLEFSDLFLMFEIYGDNLLSDEFDNFYNKVKLIGNVLGYLPSFIPDNNDFYTKINLSKTYDLLNKYFVFKHYKMINNKENRII